MAPLRLQVQCFDLQQVDTEGDNGHVADCQLPVLGAQAEHAEPERREESAGNHEWFTAVSVE